MTTFADHCLEYANKATSGDWIEVGGERILVCLSKFSTKNPSGLLADIFDPSTENGVRQTKQTNWNAEFIAKARTDLPELADRLKLAIGLLRLTSHDYRGSLKINILIDQLERIPE